jgi:Ser-tRNA(Ala) deacylase AlaX
MSGPWAFDMVARKKNFCAEKGDFKITTRKAGSDVWHEVEGVPPAAGAAVRGQLDWTRRYQLMRTHTAMHILCGVVFHDYGASVTGGNMEPLRGRMDFEFETLFGPWAIRKARCAICGWPTFSMLANL